MKLIEIAAILGVFAAATLVGVVLASKAAPSTAPSTGPHAAQLQQPSWVGNYKVDTPNGAFVFTHVIADGRRCVLVTSDSKPTFQVSCP